MRRKNFPIHLIIGTKDILIYGKISKDRSVQPISGKP